MIPLLARLLPRIWTRLLFMIITAVLMTWAVVGIAYVWLNTAQDVVDTFSTEQMPQLMQTTELAARTSALASLSNRILYSDGADPDALEQSLRRTVAELDSRLRSDFDAASTAALSGRLQRELARVIRALNRSRELHDALRLGVEQLRWTSVDIQDEAASLVADFAFNIQSLTRSLTMTDALVQRQALAATLRSERELHSTFVALGNGGSVAATLATQAAASVEPEQLERYAGILADTLASINTHLQQLPERDEFVTLRQSFRSLNQLTVGPDGIVALRQPWLQERSDIRAGLETSLGLLSDIQNRVSRLAQQQRRTIVGISEQFTTYSSTTLRLLIATTAFAALGGLAILFLYIRPAIIRPLQALTSDMRDIAAGREPSMPPVAQRNDEIAALTRAVGAFQTSVTERDRAIDELRQTQSDLVQAGKMAALGNLSAGISHELNQPLGAIRYRLHMADKALAQNDLQRLRGQIDKIESLVTRMEKNITHLRRFARRAEYLREPVGVVPTIRAAAELLGSQLTHNAIELVIDDELENAVVLGDAVLIEQVLVNLLSNANDAMAAAGQGGRIHVRAEDAPPGQVAFSVLDTGIGLGDLEPDRAFEPFVTTKEPGQGLGLGLSISYNILSGMQGSLQLARRRGAGTRATVTLPDGSSTAHD